MSRPSFNRAQTNVSNWLDGQYEYMEPDHDFTDDSKRHNPYVPRDAYQDHTPDSSDKGFSRDKGHRSYKDDRFSRDYHHRPITPPSEDELDRHRERDRGRDRDRDRRHSHRTSQSLSGKDGHDGDREDRRHPRHDKESRYPPKADRGRPVRPPLNSHHTSPYMSRKDPKDKEESPERHHRSRRYSASSSPPRQRKDKPSYRDDHASTRSSKRDRDTRSHHGSSTTKAGSTATSSNKTPRRPSLSHTKTAPSGKSFSGRAGSFSFLSDPRFTAAATAAFEAGTTAAIGAVGSKGAGVKVARAALGAAALNAFRSPPPSPAPAPAAIPAPAEPVRPGAKAGEVVGGYAAEHLHRSKGSTRRRH